MQEILKELKEIKSMLETLLKRKNPHNRVIKPFPHDSEPYKLAKTLEKRIQRNDKTFKCSNMQLWAWEINKMITIDNRNPKEIRALIIAAQSDEFERTVILEASKLRKHYTRLKIKFKSRLGAWRGKNE
jgi:hypothetical protein